MNESPQLQNLDYERKPTTLRPGLSTKATNPQNMDYQRKPQPQNMDYQRKRTTPEPDT
jgi:hypothetical protein